MNTDVYALTSTINTQTYTIHYMHILYTLLYLPNINTPHSTIIKPYSIRYTYTIYIHYTTTLYSKHTKHTLTQHEHSPQHYKQTIKRYTRIANDARGCYTYLKT